MARALALATLLFVTPALAGDRPERAWLTPQDEPREQLWAADQHPVVVAGLVTVAVITALSIVAAVVASSSPYQQPFPGGCRGCEGDSNL